MTTIRQIEGEYSPDRTEPERHLPIGVWPSQRRHRGSRVVLVVTLGLALIGGATTAAASSRGGRHGPMPPAAAPYLAQSEWAMHSVDSHLRKLLQRRGGPERALPLCSFQDELDEYVAAREALRRRIEAEREGGAGTLGDRLEVATLLGDLREAYGDVLSCYR
jgi:hypothetical protein